MILVHDSGNVKLGASGKPIRRATSLGVKYRILSRFFSSKSSSDSPRDIPEAAPSVTRTRAKNDLWGLGLINLYVWQKGFVRRWHTQ